MASPYLILWARGEPTTYTVEFDVNESGHYPVAVNHRPAFYVGDGCQSKTEGRSLSIRRCRKVLEKPDTMRFRVPIASLDDDPQLTWDEVERTNLDEATNHASCIMLWLTQRTARGRTTFVTHGDCTLLIYRTSRGFLHVVHLPRIVKVSYVRLKPA